MGRHKKVITEPEERKKPDMVEVPLMDVVEEHVLVRGLRWPGAFVIVDLDERADLDQIQPMLLKKYLIPLNRHRPKPQQHWKIQKRVEPITLVVTWCYGDCSCEFEGYDLTVEDFEQFLQEDGIKGRKVTFMSVDSIKGGLENGKES